MMVKFATLCDSCHKRSNEYMRWPYCMVCMRDICYDCLQDESLREADFEQPECGMCKDCEE